MALRHGNRTRGDIAMNGAQALFEVLTDAGLDTFFANPGTSGMQLVYEIGRTI
jgi:acetolactate synthase-1/2/3 large subunit